MPLKLTKLLTTLIIPLNLTKSKTTLIILLNLTKLSTILMITLNSQSHLTKLRISTILTILLTWTTHKISPPLNILTKGSLEIYQHINRWQKQAPKYTNLKGPRNMLILILLSDRILPEIIYPHNNGYLTYMLKNKKWVDAWARAEIRQRN